MAASRNSALALALVVAAAARAQAEEVIGFEQAVSQALGRNPSAQIAVEEVARAQALVEQARAASLPSLGVGGAYTRLDGGPTVSGAGTIDSNLVSANLLLALPLVQPRAWAQWKHARENVDVARLSSSQVKRDLAAATARTYLSILAQRRIVDATERARATAEAHYSYAHQRFAGGYGTRVDEVRAAQEAATDRSQEETARAQLTRLRESLGVLVGADRPLDVTDDVSLPSPPPLAEAERETAGREDLRLFRGRLELAARVRRDSWTEYLPSLGLSIQPFWQSQPTPLLPGSGWQAQLALAWPLYDGGLRYGVIHERRSLEREAQLNLQNAERQASAEVRAADDEVKRAHAALDSVRVAARLAEEALSLTNLGYQAGASTNIEVIDAERRARDAETQVAQAEDAWRQATLDLLLATGRFPGPR